MEGAVLPHKDIEHVLLPPHLAIEPGGHVVQPGGLLHLIQDGRPCRASTVPSRLQRHPGVQFSHPDTPVVAVLLEGLCVDVSLPFTPYSATNNTLMEGAASHTQQQVQSVKRKLEHPRHEAEVGAVGICDVPERHVEKVRDVPPVHPAAELVHPLVPAQPVGEIVLGQEAIDRPYPRVPRRQGAEHDVPILARRGVRDVVVGAAAPREDALVLPVVILDEAVAVWREGSGGARRRALDVVSVRGVEVLGQSGSGG